MLLRTSKQDGNLWPVSHNVTVRPVASKVHPTDNLARDPNDTRQKASTTENELCSFTRTPSRGFASLAKNEKHATFVTYEVFNSSSKTNQIYELESSLNPSHLRNTCSEQWCVSDAIEAKNAELEGKRMRSMKKQEKAFFGWPPASSEHFCKVPKLRKTKSLQFKVTGDVVSKLIWKAHGRNKKCRICQLKNANDLF